MTNTLTVEGIARLEKETNIWFASVRTDGRPHLAPVWFVYLEGMLYIGTDPHSVKYNNVTANPRVSLALEGGEHPVICEGTARPVSRPLPQALLDAFFRKYEWDLTKEEIYSQVIEISPNRWLSW